MTIRKFLLILFSALITLSANAAKVDSVAVYSKAMGKQLKTFVITPDCYADTKALPVVYLLHGYGDKAGGGWLKKGGGIDQLADMHGLIIVLPDGGFSSWYFDSPVDPKFRYETHITKELVPLIDGLYKTVANRSGRAITGLSMGGHGALYLAIRHPHVFSAAGSMSGGVDIRPFAGKWDIAKRLGSYSDFPERWETNTVTNMLSLLSAQQPLALIIDCGTDDFFYEVNTELHRKLLKKAIPHDFISRPGGHTWSYWSNAIKYQLLFMATHFKQQTPK